MMGRSRESTELRQQIDSIQAAIAKEEEKATQLELRAKYASFSFNIHYTTRTWCNYKCMDFQPSIPHSEILSIQIGWSRQD